MPEEMTVLLLNVKLSIMGNYSIKNKYTDEELEEFKTLINGKLQEAKKQLAFYEQQLKELAENPDIKLRGLEDGTGSVESERLINLAGRAKKHIQHLENALIRIKNKVYGICRITGKLISKQRLRAVPHATLSIEAKETR
jgi:RNA polymerase-binding transcription factor DksA